MTWIDEIEDATPEEIVHFAKTKIDEGAYKPFAYEFTYWYKVCTVNYKRKTGNDLIEILANYIPK